ncbi:putative pilus assembly protein PilV [Vitreoscilla sp. C1]|uniref:type IV pilus modification protein PilV n=1 Tax=Vitreoscilla sp. (strain C1) TaxID=96942 RepID=UPI000CDC7A41|nr:type IV pilus modification protein PilV [Vitreoscilla sp. C1]AUZ04339.1 putative pilus assembly protein PilV [Vitreoscilla sp. C1]
MKNHHYPFSHRQHGSTLLEILVSVFVLGFGLLALVSMQLKTVTSAREAENQTIIAHAGDSFVEAMMMNPARSLVEKNNEALALQRDFGAYVDLTDGSITKNCTDDSALSLTGTAGTSTSGVNKEAVAKAHVCSFVKRINQIPSSGKVSWNICQEQSDSIATAPSFTGTGDDKKIACGGAGTNFVLKVIWEQELEDAEQYKNTDIILNEDNTAVLYTYQVPIG